MNVLVGGERFTAMHELSDAQEEFLSQHNIPYSYLFDANGHTIKQVLDTMHCTEKFYAYNTKKNICLNGHEAIRTRGNHCSQCDLRRLGIYKRHHKPGFVYISISLNDKFIKIGSSSDVDSRLSPIRNESYGGISDWVLLLRMSASNSGELEFKIQSDLLHHAVTEKSYQKNGLSQNAREIFKVEYDVARQAVIANASKIEFESIKEDIDLIRKMNLKIS